MITATAAPDFAPATCRSCGQRYHYQPCYSITGFDYGNISGICDGCESARQAEEKRFAEDERRAAVRNRIAEMIPEDIRDTDLRHPEFNSALWNTVRKWRPGPDSLWLGIVGHAGKCKTRCMSLLAAQAMHAGIRVQWTTAIRLKEICQDRHHRENAIAIPAREHFGECKRAGWLFIDDLGKQGDWSAAYEALMFDLLDHRKTNRLATVFSSNAHPDEFSQLISPINASPIIGRLLDRTLILQISA